jgi:metal-sulfur cluster biosynthetic enzyme
MVAEVRRAPPAAAPVVRAVPHRLPARPVHDPVSIVVTCPYCSRVSLLQSYYTPAVRAVPHRLPARARWTFKRALSGQMMPHEFLQLLGIRVLYIHVSVCPHRLLARVHDPRQRDRAYCSRVSVLQPRARIAVTRLYCSHAPVLQQRVRIAATRPYCSHASVLQSHVRIAVTRPSCSRVSVLQSYYTPAVRAVLHRGRRRRRKATTMAVSA